jgi:hypothetical protein
VVAQGNPWLVSQPAKVRFRAGLRNLLYIFGSFAGVYVMSVIDFIIPLLIPLFISF